MTEKKQMRKRKQKKHNYITYLVIFLIWGLCFLWGVQTTKADKNFSIKSVIDDAQTKAISSDSSIMFEGKTIVIDAGHGGFDPGTIGPITGAKESDTNLSIAMKLEQRLKELGATVRMTRTTENTEALGDSRKFSEEERAAVIESEDADLMLSMHQNFNEQSSDIMGVQVLVRDEKYLQMAEFLQSEFNLALDVNLNCIHKPYRLLQYGNQPSFIIECGFFSNPQEEKKLQTEEYQETLIDILIEALSAYWKLPSE